MTLTNRRQTYSETFDLPLTAAEVRVLVQAALQVSGMQVARVARVNHRRPIRARTAPRLTRKKTPKAR